MAISQARSKRKVSGGRYRSSRSKKKHELGNRPTLTRLAETRKLKTVRIIGGNQKQFLLAVHEINVTDKQGKATKTKILNVVENVANPNLVRRNVLTKGAVVETSLGKARVTSRPGQEGTVNGVLVG